jgi:hypothetical protein
MSRAVTLPVPEPLALLEATLLFAVQLLVAHNPDLLALPDDPPKPTPRLRAAHHIVDAIREVQYALDRYRASLANETARTPAGCGRHPEPLDVAAITPRLG